MTLITHINPAGIRMNNRQARIVGGQTAPQIPTLLRIHRTTVQSLECGLLLLRHAFFYGLESDPGSACEKRQTLQRGRARPFAGPARHQSMIAAAEVMLFCGDLGTNPLSTIACRPGP